MITFLLQFHAEVNQNRFPKFFFLLGARIQHRHMDILGVSWRYEDVEHNQNLMRSQNVTFLCLPRRLEQAFTKTNVCWGSYQR